MATTAFYTYPLDQPRETSPGFRFAERDNPGQCAPTRGFGALLGGESAVGRAKGDRAESQRPARHALTGAGPFGVAKGGR